MDSVAFLGVPVGLLKVSGILGTRNFPESKHTKSLAISLAVGPAYTEMSQSESAEVRPSKIFETHHFFPDFYFATIHDILRSQDISILSGVARESPVVTTPPE